MKVYVASPFRRWPEALIVAEKLVLAGHSITHKWWEKEKDNGVNLNSAECIEVALNDEQGVRDADAVVALAFPNEGCGMFVEIGMAIAQDKPVYLVNGLSDAELPVRRSVFESLMTEISTDELIKAVTRD